MDISLRYGPALVRKAQRLLASRADAQDVAQALFLDLLCSGRSEVELPYLFGTLVLETRRSSLLQRQSLSNDYRCLHVFLKRY